MDAVLLRTHINSLSLSDAYGITFQTSDTALKQPPVWRHLHQKYAYKELPD